MPAKRSTKGQTRSPRGADALGVVLQEIKGEIGGIKADIGGIKADIGGLRGEIGEIRAEIGEIRGEIGEIKGEIGEIKGTLREHTEILRVHGEDIRAQGILLEDMRSENRVVAEAVHDFGRKIDRDIAVLRAELLERIERLEGAVRQNSHDIRGLGARFDQLEARLDQREIEIRAVRKALDSKADSAALAAIELRVAALERAVLAR